MINEIPSDNKLPNFFSLSCKWILLIRFHLLSNIYKTLHVQNVLAFSIKEIKFHLYANLRLSREEHVRFHLCKGLCEGDAAGVGKLLSLGRGSERKCVFVKVCVCG